MSFNLPLNKNFGGEIRQMSPILSNQLSQMYSDIVNALSQCPKKWILTGADPPANDPANSFFSIGDIATRTDTDSAWIMTSRTSQNAVTWTAIT
jgi:hypothetical protein